MNQENIIENTKIINSIFNPSFSNLVNKYYSEMYKEDEGTELDIYVQDILDVMNVHKTNYKQDIVMLSGILTLLVKNLRKKALELNFENESL